MACAGDIPTLETLAAVDLLRQHFPDIKIRVVNVVDLMTLQTSSRASARAARQRIRFDVHDRQARDICLSRLSLADSPAHLPAGKSRVIPRPRLQGRRHDHDAVRHDRVERVGPASTWRAMRWIACRGCNPSMRISNSSCAINWWSTSSTFASTATICRKSAIGSGRTNSEMKILVLNSGSSSQKSCLYDIGDALPEHPPEPVWQAKAEWNGDRAEVTIETARRRKAEGAKPVASREKFLERCSRVCGAGKRACWRRASEINVVGHRVVNGGKDFQRAHRDNCRGESGDRPNVRVCTAAQSRGTGGDGDC